MESVTDFTVSVMDSICTFQIRFPLSGFENSSFSGLLFRLCITYSRVQITTGINPNLYSPFPEFQIYVNIRFENCTHFLFPTPNPYIRSVLPMFYSFIYKWEGI